MNKTMTQNDAETTEREALQKSSGTQRCLGLDLIKTIAIFMVVVYHAEAGNYANWGIVHYPHGLRALANYAITGAMAVCVPLFFLVNGALLFSRPLKIRRHMTKTLTVVVLTFVWSCITQASFEALGLWNRMSFPDMIRNTYHLQDRLNNHLWFFCALVVLYCLFPLLKSVWDHERSWFLCFLVIALVCTFGVTLLRNGIDVARLLFGAAGKPSQIDPVGPFNPLRGIEGWSIVYFMLGALLFERRKQLVGRKTLIFSSLVFMFAMLVFCLYNLSHIYAGEQGYDHISTGYDDVCVLLMAVSLFIMLVNCRFTAAIGKLLSFIGSNTLGIYVIHWIVLGAGRALGWDFPGHITFLIPPYLLYGLIVMTICALMCWILRKIPVVRRLIMM
ncbi:acyltransferase [Bifidobacterium oedipodis]|uniref:Acyltransferase family n=1 Tax=Bifidobacterium oedipodis TaxID=2675322 RepID=A0A7Y0ESB7_9BIFI|nr:acyltransferase family protein [Bifidobacterium sp. DSM 109957]NMM95098.1 Acyltransferase family [Bifidobacterium sp. DSM 109957]